MRGQVIQLLMLLFANFCSGLWFVDRADEHSSAWPLARVVFAVELTSASTKKDMEVESDA